MTWNKKRWQGYWEKIADESSSNYVIDRGVELVDRDCEVWSMEKLITFAGPRKGDVVLDAGCGTGVNSERMSKQVKEVIGLDFSEGMLRRAQRRITEESLQNIRLMVGSITDLGLKHRSFDIVICVSVMQYLNDNECEAALGELVRVVKDGGTIVLHVKNLTSIYLYSLFVAKKIKQLVCRETKLEHYRPGSWYEKRIRALGGKLIDYYSGNVFVIDIMPKKVMHKMRKIEMKYDIKKHFGKYGGDYHMKFIVKREGVVNLSGVGRQ
jgi:ubiquinone/menaquinone biosynthesis C-methylase UbiE